MLPNRTILKQFADKLQQFRVVLRLVKLAVNLYFIDEAVFSSKLSEIKVWAKQRGPAPTRQVSKIGFKAIAATAAIDTAGRVVAYTTDDSAVNVEKFLRFLMLLRTKLDVRETQYLYVDNMRVH